MKYVKNFKLICLIVFPLLAGIFSCGDPCGPFPNKYKTTGLELATLQIAYADSTQAEFQIMPIMQDTLEHDQLALQLQFHQESYFAASPLRRRFELFPVVTACDPAPPDTDETIDSIVIVANNDYNDLFLSGSNLAELFDVVVTDNARFVFRQRFNLKEYLSQHSPVPNDMILILREAPTQSAIYKFDIQYYQNGIEGNDYFDMVSEPVILSAE